MFRRLRGKEWPPSTKGRKVPVESGPKEVELGDEHIRVELEERTPMLFLDPDQGLMDLTKDLNADEIGRLGAVYVVGRKAGVVVPDGIRVNEVDTLADLFGMLRICPRMPIPKRVVWRERLLEPGSGSKDEITNGCKAVHEERIAKWAGLMEKGKGTP